jgi:hypothetical protein
MTGTELLLLVADRFRQYGEAEDILVIFTTNPEAGGRVIYKANCNYTRSLGLATYAKADIEASIVASQDEDPPRQD